MGVTRWIARLFSLTQSIVPTRQVIGQDDRIQTLHSRIPWGLALPCPALMVDPTLTIDRLIRYGWLPAWDLHWPKRRCTPFHAFDELRSILLDDDEQNTYWILSPW